jgi:hypothetical protein
VGSRAVVGGPERVDSPCNTGGVSTDDPLAPLREQVAREHLGDGKVGDRLRGSTEQELRRDAEELRHQAKLYGSGRPSVRAAVFVAHERQRQLAERVLGWSP